MDKANGEIKASDRDVVTLPGKKKEKASERGGGGGGTYDGRRRRERGRAKNERSGALPEGERSGEEIGDCGPWSP